MASFDRTKETFIENKTKELIDETRTGKVIRVYEHDNLEDSSNFEADVVVDGGTREQRLAPTSSDDQNGISVPKVGDSVLVGYLAGESNDPMILGFVHTTKDRAPLGKAGMSRSEVESGDSPAGSGGIYTTEYTKYDGDPSQDDYTDLVPEESWVQIAKRENTEADPSAEGALPAKVEFYDAPANDEAHITIELNKRDSSDSDATWGLRFDLKSGEMKLVDPSGYGIVSDGDGNFDWHYKSLDYIEEPNGGSLSL